MFTLVLLGKGGEIECQEPHSFHAIKQKRLHYTYYKFVTKILYEFIVLKDSFFFFATCNTNSFMFIT